MLLLCLDTLYSWFELLLDIHALPIFFDVFAILDTWQCFDLMHIIHWFIVAHQSRVCCPNDFLPHHTNLNTWRKRTPNLSLLPNVNQFCLTLYDTYMATNVQPWYSSPMIPASSWQLTTIRGCKLLVIFAILLLRIPPVEDNGAHTQITTLQSLLIYFFSFCLGWSHFCSTWRA